MQDKIINKPIDTQEKRTEFVKMSEFCSSDMTYVLMEDDEKVYIIKSEQLDMYDNISEQGYDELRSLYAWFKQYDVDVSRAQRYARMGISHSLDVAQLDNQAQANSARMTFLRKSLEQ